ncbi:CD4-1 molecule [Acanthochromis polyacanthus]|uniref:CD4-1 molecule n=1 Tax=Acanthochromis polyacanthus TaxID=80966 RepID=UPI002234950D|nr:CD4-1 molecule [Acanthochromis polyacanthus]
MMNLITLALVVIAMLKSTGAEEVIVYAQVGETVTLKTQRQILSTHYVNWYFQIVSGSTLAWTNPYGGKSTLKDQPWNNSLSLNGHSLTISNVQEQYFGTFICKVSGSNVQTYLTTYTLIKLQVSVNPASLLLPGESLSLACSVDTQRKSVIHWLNPQGTKVSEKGALTKTVTSQDSGSWTCVVAGNEHEAKVSVKVFDLSPVTSPQYTSASSSLRIPCSFPSHVTWEEIKKKGINKIQWSFSPTPSSSVLSDGEKLFSLSPKTSLTWQVDHDKGLKIVQDVTKGNLALTRNRGKEEDRGHYTCAMEFVNGPTLKRTVRVEVLQIVSSSGTKLTSGQQVNLSCTTGNPLQTGVQLKWFPPETSSVSFTDGHPAHLTIPEVGTGDGGKWKCELKQNGTVLTSAMLTLTVEPKMTVWMLVIICSSAVIMLLLLIVAFILCRHRKRKTRHIRHQLCQCKNPKPKGFYRT